MTTAADDAGKGSRVKELVVTAAVATVVSAVVSPWLRRWMGALVAPPSSEPTPAVQAPSPPPDDFNERLERLLEVPDPFSHKAVAAVAGRNSKPRMIDVEASEAPEQ